MQTNRNDIQYISAPEKTAIDSEWFHHISEKQFWMKRRFRVFQKLWGNLLELPEHQPVLEIGCGNGILQKQIEKYFGFKVTGFDLNETALKNNISQSPVYCYNINNRNEIFRKKFKTAFLFDIIEHIKDDISFLHDVRFHLKQGGNLFINVPADPTLYSRYDRLMGHERRYLKQDLSRLEEAGFSLADWTFWGYPFYWPAYLIRKFQKNSDRKKIIESGTNPLGGLINTPLQILSLLEKIPQKKRGTSIMALFHVK